MIINRTDHFVLTVNDLEASIAFYEGVLGMRHVILPEGQHTLRFGNERIGLHEKTGVFLPEAQQPTPGSQDFCLIADGDIHEIEKEVEEKGVRIIEGVVPRDGALGVMDSIYMYDPDGNLVEIAVYRA